MQLQMKLMPAIGYHDAGPVDRADSLVDIELPVPHPGGRDLLVEIKAISVNPVDTKVRLAVSAGPDSWKVLGWDASGVVVAAGPDATLFAPGDEVFYAGAYERPGTNQQFHLVDERIVGAKPKSLDWAGAAALPLTSITAWETLFDRLRVNDQKAETARVILIVGGAGGVGSMAIQLARTLTNLTIIASASRPETTAWVHDMGAHHIIDHRRPMAIQLASLDVGAPAFIFSTTNTAEHLDEIVDIIAPQGRFAVIDDPPTLDVVKFKPKSVSIHWESMFARSMYETSDMAEQGRLLNDVSRLVDEGKLRTTLTERVSPINAANLKHVHATIESGTARGKIVLENFSS